MTDMRTLAAIAVLTGDLGLALPATAAPFAGSLLPGGAMIEPVAGGCGPGFHPNPWGLCRPNRGWGPPRFYGPAWGYDRPRPYYYRSYGYYRPRPFYY